MLPELAAEVLQFPTRRDLDKACGVSKWLDALMAQCCEVYPLRRVPRVALYQQGNDVTPSVVIRKDDDAVVRQWFSTMDEAALFVGSILRRSYVESLELGAVYVGPTTLFPGHWSTLSEAIRSGAVPTPSVHRHRPESAP